MNNDRSTIDNAQLPEGYQQTEVGVIPEDWDITSIDQVELLFGASPRLKGKTLMAETSHVLWLRM